MSFTARRGEVVALVGASGAGKSTLVDLIPRFYEPTGGVIRLDGVDTREITLASLRALTGIVSQDTVLFNDTVRNNIAYGAAGPVHATRRSRRRRARRTRTTSSASCPRATTRCSASAARGSPAASASASRSRARCSIDPPILILDEATSALDTESERLVQEAIDRLLAGRTVFVIAHRLSTVVHADQILVLDRGEIVERGTHAELLAQRGAYHRLHAAQLRRDDDDATSQADRRRSALTMRVLFYYTANNWTGSARAFAVAARGLAARGEPVTVACCAGQRRSSRRSRARGSRS